MQSVVSYPERGPWGNNKYRGNCSGYLIKDLIEQFHIKNMSDYMVGGGTTEDVCRDLKIPGTFLDLNRGFDMMNMDIPDRPESIFWHSPYDRAVVYSGNMYDADEVDRKYGIDCRANDLSRCRDWDEFVKKMNYCMLKQFTALQPGGYMFSLVGDIKKNGQLYSMISDIVKPGRTINILIKLQHHCTSDSFTYSNNNFIPIVHEYVLISQKEKGFIIPISMTIRRTMDMRDSLNTTWRDTVHAVLEQYGRSMTLNEIYEELGPRKKAKANPHWKEKIRQTLRDGRYFKRVSEGVYQAA